MEYHNHITRTTMELRDKLTITKDSLGIIKEVLLILTLLIAIFSGSNLVKEQEKLITKKQNVADEQLRSQYIDKIQTLNIEIQELDKKLANDTSWKGSSSWERFETVRKLKLEELKRIENELKKAITNKVEKD